MKLDIWTFLFQIINFFVLLYILKRFLYKPVREIMEKRRGLIEKTMTDAERIKKEAQELKGKKQEEIEKLKDLQIQTSEVMHEKVKEERRKLLSEAENEANSIIERKKSLFEIEKKRFESELKGKAIEAVSHFASNILYDISNEEIHKGIYRKFLQELKQIIPNITATERKEKTVPVDLISAYPLDEQELEQFREIMETHLSKQVVIATTVDKGLIAGLKMKVYDIIYDSSLLRQIETLTQKLKETVPR